MDMPYRPEWDKTEPQTAEDVIGELADLPKVTLISEDKDEFIVEYKGEQISVEKNDETCFVSGGAVEAVGMGLRCALQQGLGITDKIYQDDEAREFMDVMIFHEIREKEYKEAGFEDAHQRAVHDEILYIMVHLPEKQRAYFEFAKEYREARAQQPDEDEKDAENNESADEESPEEIESRERELEERRREWVKEEALRQIEIENENNLLVKVLNKKIDVFLEANPDFIADRKENTVALPGDGVPVKIEIKSHAFSLSSHLPGLKNATCNEITALLKDDLDEAEMCKIWEKFGDTGRLKLRGVISPEKVRQVHDLLQKDILECEKIMEEMKKCGFICPKPEWEPQFRHIERIKDGNGGHIVIEFEKHADQYGTTMSVHFDDLKKKLKRSLSALGKKHQATEINLEDDIETFDIKCFYDPADYMKAIQLFDEISKKVQIS